MPRLGIQSFKQTVFKSNIRAKSTNKETKNDLQMYYVVQGKVETFITRQGI
mgnify:CR=1 FL=1